MKRRELCIHLYIPEAQKRPIVMALMCTDDPVVVAVHDTGTVKLRARCFSRPALTEEAMIGKPDTAKGTIINAFVFFCLTHTPSDWLNYELPYPVRISLGLTAMLSRIGFV
jgi:acyl-coenzyme A synthetase/AMP-(fatty) acid ligase